MRIEARVDYGLRALIELSRHDRTVTGHELADALDLSPKFLATVLSSLRRAGLIHTRRGSSGGYCLARPAEDITVADVLVVLQGATDATDSPYGDLWQGLLDSFLDAARCRSVAEIASSA